MFSENKNVAALIVTYNRQNLLIECLAAVKEQAFTPSTIVVIDNASTDGTDGLFADGGIFDGDPNIVYCRMKENLGGAGGFKEGIRKCMDLGCDWVWLMDDDCIARPDTLSSLMDAAEASTRYGAEPSFLASSVYGPQGEAMNVPVVDTRADANGYPDWYRALAEGMVEIESATFVSLLINRRAIEQLGLPIADFFIWGDDTEYTTRLTHYFGPAYMVGTSKVLHKRANAKSLDIRNENDPIRIANFHRLYKNNLVVKKYHYGNKAAVKTVLVNIKNAFSCLAKGGDAMELRFARFRAIIVGVFEFVAHRYELEDLECALGRGRA